MKLAVIGGSAFSTPSLIEFLSRNLGPEQIDVVLASRSADRTESVGRACSLLLHRNFNIQTKSISNERWSEILDNVNCVLIQIRVGGHEGRLFDETFPHKYGLCGDEGLGVGGMSAAWRTWPELAQILDAVGKCCPLALVILLTSPVSLLVRAAYKHTNLNVVGICELPWVTLQDLHAFLGASPSQVRVDYLGLNHLGWFFNFRCDSPTLNEIAASIGDDTFPSGEFLRTHRCFPTRYLRMHYQPEKTLAEQMSQKIPRAAALKCLQAQAYKTYLDGPAVEIASILAARPSPWYSQAVGPLILALTGRSTETPFFLSVRNDSYTNLLLKDDVLECRHHWNSGQLERVPLSNPPPTVVTEPLMQFASFERVATEATMKNSVPLLMAALSLHPWTSGHTQLRAIANEIVAYNSASSWHPRRIP